MQNHHGDEGAFTILVVDDEPRIVDVVSQMLRAAGYRVVQAVAGRQALQIAERAAIDLVLSDVNMPEMSGIELAMRLRSISPELPVLFMSGSPTRERCPSGVLAKPFHMTELHDRVAEALRAHVY